MGHKHGERVLIDAVREVRPPFSPAEVTADFVRLLKAYRINSVRGDHFAGQWVAEAFRLHGVTFRPSEENKSALYGEFLPLLNTGTVVLLDDHRMVGQLASLERRTRFGGRGESIDHPPKAHDDLANVVAGMAVHTQRARGGGYGYEDRSTPPRVVQAYDHVKNF